MTDGDRFERRDWWTPQPFPLWVVSVDGDRLDLGIVLGWTWEIAGDVSVPVYHPEGRTEEIPMVCPSEYALFSDRGAADATRAAWQNEIDVRLRDTRHDQGA